MTRVAALARGAQPSARGAAPVVGRHPFSSRPRRAAASGGSVTAGLAAVGAAFRAGATPAEAWWHGWGVRCDAGTPRWDDVVDRCGGDLPTAAAVRAAASLAVDTGAPPAAVLDRLGAALADEQEVAAQRAAAMAGPRATARLLAWLPAFGVLLGLAVGADPVGVLTDGRLGTGLLAVAGLLTWSGRRWSAGLLTTAERAGVVESSRGGSP